jgi:hypothetical protein
MVTLFVVGGVTVLAVVLVMVALGRARGRSRAAHAADLEGMCRYAGSRGLALQQAADKAAFTATGTLAGLPVTLVTSHLRMVSSRGHLAQGPIETHLRTRGLPPALRLLVARPVGQRREVEEPLGRGVDRLAVGEPAFDAVFQCFAPDSVLLQRWLDPTCRREIEALGELREVRLADGELSLSLVPAVWLGGSDDTAWYHVHPLVRSPETIDRAAALLARLHANARALG